MKTFLFATAALAIGATAALADDVSGDYCLSDSVSNGHEPLTYEQIPRTNIFRRGSDCPEEERVRIVIENGELAIEGAGLDLIFSVLPPRDLKEKEK
jgi:hypothetical protein